MKIAIASWCAWWTQADGTARALSCVRGELLETQADKPRVEGVKPIQKRRLSPLARLVFAALDHAGEAAARGPVIFSSTMGELNRTHGILATLAADEPVSPAAFSLSVHNAIAGLWSMLRDNTAPMLALSPAGGSPAAALVEAAGILGEGREREVSVVLYEEPYPAFYHPYRTGPEQPYALALSLVAPGTPGVIELDLEAGRAGARRWATDLDLLPLLRGEQGALTLGEPQMSWRLARCQ
ncbi:MAG: 3-oxoacyl-ACP synthase [Halioglobus sp.]|nr:3-oxoacyl-ACP synthase [Halioglobus sp.]